MIVSCFSDLHVEFQPVTGMTIADYIIKSIPKEKADICVLAGDIGMIKNHTTMNINPLLNTLKKFCDHFKNIIYIHGNHEYYKNSISQGQRDFQKKVASKLPNLHWLNNEVLVIDGQRFLGCTLWAELPEIKADSTFGYYDTKERYYRQMNCFDQISDLKTIFESEHDKSVAFIKNNLQKGDVLITHFPVVTFTGDPRFKDHESNWYYQNNLDEFILEKEPKLVISAHCHNSIDRIIGKTRFIRNPFGYFKHEENYEFKTNMLIEI